MKIEEMREDAARLLRLLEEPHPGLSTWQAAVANVTHRLTKMTDNGVMPNESSKFTIDSELLGLVAFVSCHVGGCWFLKTIHDQIKPEYIQGHLVSLAMDLLSSKLRKSLCLWGIGAEPLSEEDRIFFTHNGFIRGNPPTTHGAVLDWCNTYTNVYLTCF